MSFKIRIEEILKQYHLNPKKFGEKLGYSKPDKLYRLLKDNTNNPSIHIIQDILKAFPDINARWLVTGEEKMIFEEPRTQYGYCKECIKKEAIIEHLKGELADKDKRIEELVRECANLTGMLLQEKGKKQAS
jgi:hypothetical protein